MADHTTQTSPVEDQWTKWDYPVLLALARWDAETPGRHILMRDMIVNMVGVFQEDAWTVGRALLRLTQAGLIESESAMDGTPWPSFVTAITPAGLRAAGVWPTPDSMRERLIAEMEAVADRISEREPQKASKLREVAEFFRGAGVEIISNVLTNLLKPGP